MLFLYRFGSPKSSPQRSPAKPKLKGPIRNSKRNRELLSLPRQSDAPKEKERKVAVTDAIQNLIDLNQTSQNVTAEKTSSEKQQPPTERPNSNSKTAEAAAKATSSSSRSDDQMEASTSKIPPAETVHVEQPGRDHPPPPGEEEQQQQTSHEEMPDKESPGTTRSFLDSTPSMKGLSDISDDTLPPNDQLKSRVSELSADLSDVTLPDDSNAQLKAGLSDISDGDLPPDDSNVIIPTRRTSAALSEMSDGNLALCEMVIGREDDEHELLEDGELLDETLVPNETSHEDSAKTKEATDAATDRSSVVFAQKFDSEENKTEAEIRIGMEDEEIDTEDMELEDGELPTTSQATPNDDNNTRSEQPMVKDINLDEMTKIKSKWNFI